MKLYANLTHVTNAQIWSSQFSSYGDTVQFISVFHLPYWKTAALPKAIRNNVFNYLFGIYYTQPLC